MTSDITQNDGARTLWRHPALPDFKLRRHAAYPYFWVEALCFVLFATPFELEAGSGYGYAIKTICLLVLIAPRIGLALRTVQGHTLWIGALAAAFLLVNTAEASDRAVFAAVLMILGATAGQMRSSQWVGRLGALCAVYLLVHLLGFIIAAFLFYSMGTLVDMHGLVFPTASRIDQIGTAARLSGFHNEPGTYAQWMLIVVFLHSMVTRRIISVLSVAVAASALLTTSLWAVVGVTLFLVAGVLEALSQSRIGQGLKTALTIGLLVLAGASAFALLPDTALSDALTLLLQKSGLQTQSGVNKVFALAAFQEALPSIIIFGDPLVPGLCPSCLSPQDLGLWANATYYLGLAPMVILAAALASKLALDGGPRFIPALCIMMLWKAQFYDPLLWFIIGFILCGRFPSTTKNQTSAPIQPRRNAP